MTCVVVWPFASTWAVGLASAICTQLLILPLACLTYMLRGSRLLWLLVAVTTWAPFWLLHIAHDAVSAGYFLSMEQLKFGAFFSSTVFSVAIFRIVEQAAGTSPPGATVTLRSWMTYFGAACDVRYKEDGNPVRPIALASVHFLERIVYRLVGITVICSLLKQFGMRPFTVALQGEVGAPGMWPLEQPTLTCALAHVADVYVQTFVVFLFLAFAYDVGGLLLCAQRHVPAEVFRHPLVLSTSPRDFWGRRWNLMVHSTLRRSVFEPVTKGLGWSRSSGALASFAASAAFHEYQFTFGFFPEYIPGKVTLFFLAQAFICAAQAKLEKVVPTSHIPRVVKWFLTILAICPVGHIFTGIWIQHGMFDKISTFTFMVEC